MKAQNNLLKQEVMKAELLMGNFLLFIKKRMKLPGITGDKNQGRNIKTGEI